MAHGVGVRLVVAGWAVGQVIGPAVCQVDAAPDPARRSYYVYVCAESDDQVAVVRYGPGGAEVVKTVTVGSYPTEIEGPHGITVDPGRPSLVRVDCPRVSVRQRAQVRNRDGRVGRRRYARLVSRDARRLADDRIDVRGELQSSRGEGAEQHLGGRGRHDVGSGPCRNGRHAARVACESGRDATLLRQYDGVRAGRDGRPRVRDHPSVAARRARAADVGNPADRRWGGVRHREQRRADLRGGSRIVDGAADLRDRRRPVQPRRDAGWGDARCHL